MVQVAAQIHLLLLSKSDHLTAFAHIVAQRLLHQHMLSVRHRLHRRFKMPAAVVNAACRHIDDLKVRLILDHVLKRIVRLYAMLLRSRVGALLDDVAYRNDISQFILLIAVRMVVSDAVHAYDSDFDRHVQLPFILGLG